jgi:hypothetical protein
MEYKLPMFMMLCLLVSASISYMSFGWVAALCTIAVFSFGVWLISRSEVSE